MKQHQQAIPTMISKEDNQLMTTAANLHTHFSFKSSADRTME